MITIVFILGVFNLALGFALAVYAEPTSTWLAAWFAAGDVHTLPAQPLVLHDVDPATPALPRNAAAVVPVPVPFDPQSLPRNWRCLLKEHGIEPASTLESLLWMMKLELFVVRRQFVHLEIQLRNADGAAAESTGGDHGSTVIGHWQTNQQKWCARLDEFASQMTLLNEQSTQGAIGCALQDLLLDLQFDTHQAATSLKLMGGASGQDMHAAGTSNAGNLRRQLSEQIDDIHLIRDRVEDLLATLLREDGRLGDIDLQLQLEGATEIYNRIGFEVIFQQWRDSNPNGERPVCCLMVDIDRFSQKNERFGNEIGDVILAAFGGLLKSLIRIERGFDRVARFNGHTFAIFLGNTKFDDGTTVAERTRQCVEATSFQVGSETFDVTTSLGLMEFDPNLNVPTFYQSLQEAVTAAKNAGRNRTCVFRGNQAEIAATASIQVKGRVIEIATRRKEPFDESMA